MKNETTLRESGGEVTVDGVEEKIDELVLRTLEATLKRISSSDCTASDLSAATKLIKEFEAFDRIKDKAAANEQAAKLAHELAGLSEIDEYGNELPMARTN